MKRTLPFDSTHHARRPAGLVVSWPHDRGAPRQDLGSYFVACACLEAASVVAFVHLASDLKSMGAPVSLVDQAERAQTNAMHHGEDLLRLAKQFRKSPATFSFEGRRPRSRALIACENAVEGCVREAYGASVALWQARTAKGPDVREAFAFMAHNKLKSADLARAVAEWLEPQLTPTERRIVSNTHKAAVSALWDEITLPVSPLIVNVAGVPTMDAALFLLDELEAQLGSRRAA